MDKWQQKLQRQTTAQRALSGISFLLSHPDQGPDDETESAMDGAKLIELLNKNFKRLAKSNDGITRGELTIALTNPHDFTQDEYVMLQLMAKYFDTIVNLSDDEEGEETKITELDAQVLAQFIVDGKLSLKSLRYWCSMTGGPENNIPTPPPLTGDSA
ncbi:MAG: hypothetical protein K2W82_08625 [Candidatus Obscuribacterales bacterium]|nr:hypothetical protein [Candidatus Obscuribacterales bacterium]